MQRRDAQRGQTAAEYLGVLVLIAVTVGVLVQAGIGTRIVEAVERQICELAASDDADCSETPRAARQRALAKRRDPDGDGLSTKRERELGLAYNTADSDGDGVPDGQELRDGLDPKVGDTDRDGLSDGEEYREGTDPRKSDGDDDGLTDAQEVALGTKPGREWSDTEGGGTDGLDDYEEVYRYGTDPTRVDTDGDGDHDGEEIEQGSDPLVDERDLKDKVGEGLGNAILDDPALLAGAGGLVKGGLKSARKAINKLLGRGDEAADAIKDVRKAREAAEQRRDAVDSARPSGARLTDRDRSRMVEEAKAGTGMFGIGQARREESRALGEAFVGPGFRESSRSPGILISADGLRQYRPPSSKPKRGTDQANFESRPQASGRWLNNGHLDITD